MKPFKEFLNEGNNKNLKDLHKKTNNYLQEIRKSKK